MDRKTTPEQSHLPAINSMQIELSAVGTSCARQSTAATGEHQNEIVGRHLEGLGQLETRSFRESSDIADVAHAPLLVLGFQAGVEHRVADGGMPAVALERPVEEQPPVLAQLARRARDQPSATRHGAM
jgi:hypothetical protein